MGADDFEDRSRFIDEHEPDRGRLLNEQEPDRASDDWGDDPTRRATPAYFPTRAIGYDRAAVDAYVEQVERRIGDLEATQTPEAAIRGALERVGEETSGVLRQARETADDITARSRSAADARLETARRDADELRARGELRVRQLDADADSIWRERSRLLDDARRLAEELLAAADHADMRFPPEESPANTPLAGGDVEAERAGDAARGRGREADEEVE